ncbi:hypothetical protein [Gluconobacter thailandicus]|uniref:hypothetical protein n=1 Tax=Gluconobacter thailandicus TaxID=257438 RepID=UPI001F2AD5E5|nr:hypothetical protein [Gluconobacter thailandicus]
MVQFCKLGHGGGCGEQFGVRGRDEASAGVAGEQNFSVLGGNDDAPADALILRGVQEGRQLLRKGVRAEGGGLWTAQALRRTGRLAETQGSSFWTSRGKRCGAWLKN